MIKLTFLYQDIVKNRVLLSLFVITIFSLLAYLPFILFLGLYGDDWFFIYVGHFYGSKGLLETELTQRFVASYLFILNNFLLKDNLFLWHLAMMLVSLTGSYILFFTLKKIWSDKLLAVTLITLLFSIYPGFLQSPSSPAYLPITTNVVIWIISLAFTVLATKTQSKFKFILFTLIALIFQIFSFFVMEYFIGMEILRLMFILYILNSGKIQFINISFKLFKNNFKYLSPYLLSLGIFIFWRVIFFNSGRAETNVNWVLGNFYSNPLWIIKIPLEILNGLLSTVIFAYFIPIFIRIPRIPLVISIIAIFLGIISSWLLYLYYRLMEKSIHNKDSYNSTKIKKFGKDLLLIGFISVLSAITPIIISARTVRLFNAFDRYTVTSIIGVSFIIIGFLFLKISSPLRKLIIISVVVLSVTTHLMNGYLYVENWDKQKDIWWQLYWRAPKIEDNSLLIFDFPPLTQKSLFSEIINKVQWYRIYWTDYQIYGPANLFFNYNNTSSHNINGDYLSNKDVTEKIKGKVIDQTDKYFASNIKGFAENHLRYYQNATIILTPGDNSCLWVLDKEKQELPNAADQLLKSNIIYSDTNKLVKTDIPITPPKNIFGREPDYNWCYYFQKASLYRQLKYWDKLSILTDKVIQTNLKPRDVNEWLPFIEGLIINQKFSQAEDLIKDGFNDKNSKYFKENVCNLFDRLQTEKYKIYCQNK